MDEVITESIDFVTKNRQYVLIKHGFGIEVCLRDQISPPSPNTIKCEKCDKIGSMTVYNPDQGEFMNTCLKCF